MKLFGKSIQRREINVEVNIRFECLRPADDGWQAPTPDEVRELLRIIAAHKGIAKFTGGMAARFLGLGDQGDRTLRRWTGGATPIPYAAWALLCHEAGFGIIWQRKTDIAN
ncbi:KorC repressor protein [Stutzerimonas stutzeri B1SMN1]|nr:KorC repressor protein [Stutzerimonas stutzeri B1SMN1]